MTAYMDDLVRERAIIAHKEGVDSNAYAVSFEEWLTELCKQPQHRPPVEMALTLNGIELHLVSHRGSTYRYAPLKDGTQTKFAYSPEPPRERILRENRIIQHVKAEELLIRKGDIEPEEGEDEPEE